MKLEKERKTCSGCKVNFTFFSYMFSRHADDVKATSERLVDLKFSFVIQTQNALELLMIQSSTSFESSFMVTRRCSHRLNANINIPN